MKTPRVKLIWNGETFEPQNRSWMHVCAQNYKSGEEYWMVEEQERSKKSHSHYFAAVHSGWENLPEEYAGRYASSEHLRKAALIRMGYCLTTEIVFDNEASAITACDHIKKIDTYSIVSVIGCIVTQLVAETQKYREMGKERFQQSKQAVLDFIAALIGVDSKELAAQAGEAA